jgi:hypothetical protein
MAKSMHQKKQHEKRTSSKKLQNGSVQGHE